MRVLLVNPPNHRPKADGFPNLVFQPLGLAYLAAILKKKGFKVGILDCLGEGWNQERVEGDWRITGLTFGEIEKRLREFNPEVVGVGIPFTSQGELAHKTLAIIKKVKSNIFTLVGGADPSVRYKDQLEDKNLDAVVIGEGEETLIELLKIRATRGNWKKVPGIAYRGNGKIIKTKTRKPILSLDRLPFPARKLLPMDAYFEAAKKARAERVGSTLGKRWASLITSRGCPYHCLFCTVHGIMGKVWRPRSPENVLEEIKLLRRNFGIEHLLIEDDNLTLDLSRAEKLFDLMIAENLGITWSTPNGVRADKLTERLIIKMKKSGCTLLCVAPESGDQAVVNKIIKKNLDLQMVEKVVDWCQKHKLAVEAFFIIGFPGETIAQMRKTLDFAKKLLKLGLQEFSLFIATPFYGTELYEIAQKKGYLREIFDESRLRVDFQDVEIEPLIETPDFTAQDLINFRLEAVKISPKFSWPKIKFGLKLAVADPSLALKVSLGRLIK